MPADLVDVPYATPMHVAVRAGIGAVLISSTSDRSGLGPYLELEVGRRMSPPVSLSLYASYLTSSDAGHDSDSGYSTTWTRDRIVDVAARASYHPYDDEDGPFFGGGVGYEGIRASGVDACSMPDVPPCKDANGHTSVSFSEPFDTWSHGLVVEVHAGVTLSRIQFLVVATRSSGYTGRAMAGYQF